MLLYEVNRLIEEGRVAKDAKDADRAIPGERLSSVDLLLALVQKRESESFAEESK
ncbi:hypothetical protein [Paenibacillus alkalitolerans]|uniref:hypothetical protein n=1 Tax=Paenibacillus alkalitolerans TaxID=2799335 RepID=UPI0018F42553|nr:hypothetical protein [Paenibacillus alkalitolerans]